LSGWRVIAPDTRGFRGPDGPSAERPGEPTMEELAIDVEHVLDALGVSEAVIGGLSMGGYIALALFRRAPARFRALVLADSRATADTEQAKAGRRKMQALADAGGAAAIADDMLPKLLGDTTKRERPELERHVRALIEANSPEAIRGALAAMMTRQDSRPMLGAIACPALVVVGEEDTLTPPPDSEAMHAAIDGSTLVRIPRAGHLSNLEQPDAFNTALVRFLKDLA
jgi:3-oxoadipate enol-lactonase